MKVLHVTEAMASGILTVIESFARRQIEAGAEVSVAYLRRTESPSSGSINKLLGLNGTSTDLGLAKNRARDYAALARHVFKALSSDSYDVVHLHSAKAGFLGRLMAIASRRPDKVVYSPHGFPFLKLDVHRPVRQLMLGVETYLGKIGMVMLTSNSEYEIARDSLKCKRACLVTTGMRPEYFSSIQGRRSEPKETLPVVCMVGRITYQKAPWTFSAVARALVGKAKFVWVGDGDAQLRKKWLDRAGIEVTGWVSPEALVNFLSDCDILLFPTLWEGMSLSLIQAQAHGLPAVVTDVVGNRDAVANGKTGFICGSVRELIAATDLLISDSDLRIKMSSEAMEWARLHHTDSDLGVESLAAYRKLGD